MVSGHTTSHTSTSAHAASQSSPLTPAADADPGGGARQDDSPASNLHRSTSHLAGQLKSGDLVATDSDNSVDLVNLAVVHRTPHRIRLRIERLGYDSGYAEILQHLTALLPEPVAVRLNPPARSLVATYPFEAGQAAIAAWERQLFEIIQQAAQIDLETARRLDPEGVAEAARNQDLWERLSLPVLGMVLGLAMLFELPLSGFVVGLIILVGTRPVYERTINAFQKDGTLAIDLLDGLAITLHTVEGNFFPPALMLGMVEGGEAIRDITARGSERASLDLLSCLGSEALVERNGKEVRIPLDQLEVGERVVVYPGDQIPVDGVVLRGSGLVDQCKLTGESVPITRSVGDEVFASTLLADGFLCIEAERLGHDTRAGVIANLMQAAPVYDTRISNYATLAANQLVTPTLVLAALVGTLSGDVSRAISILTLDVGTGIRISVPTTILSALTYAARNGVLIRTGRSIELLSEVDAIVFDKTGTLTQGHAGVNGITVLDPQLDPMQVLCLAASAEQGLTHPVAEAVIRHAHDCGLDLAPCDAWEYHVGLGVEAQIQGQHIWVGSHRLMAQQQISLDHLRQAHPELETGPHSLVYVAAGQTLVGVILYSDPIRAESPAVVQALQAQGIEVYMLTGDVGRVAHGVAQALDIPADQVYAEAFPERKVEVVKALHDSGKTVAFCGDGINDSAALAYADVSISFAGASGIARETADVVLMEDDLSGLHTAIAIAQQAMAVVQQNVALVIAPNLTAVAAGVFLAINPVLAILINNGSAILAELNGLRPLLGPGGGLPDGLLNPALRTKQSLKTAAPPDAAAGVTPEPTDDSASSAPVTAESPQSSGATISALAASASAGKTAAESEVKNAAFAPTGAPKPEFPDQLIQKDLAQRLKISAQTLSRRKRREGFQAWSREKDPAGVAWCYHPKEKVFRPIEADVLRFRRRKLRSHSPLALAT
jgi:heavy metal translocating P-type ATPase